MLSEYIIGLADVSFHIVAYIYARFRNSRKNPMRFAVFWRISVRFCGFLTPLTLPSLSFRCHCFLFLTQPPQFINNRLLKYLDLNLLQKYPVVKNIVEYKTVTKMFCGLGNSKLGSVSGVIFCVYYFSLGPSFQPIRLIVRRIFLARCQKQCLVSWIY